MEVLFLDQQFRQVCLIDTFESLIWTERYIGAGNFDLYMPANTELLSMIKQDYYAWLKDSEQVMIVEDIQINTEIETGGHLIISGRSLESILDRRIIWQQTILSGNLQNAIRRLLNENVISPSIAARRINGFVFQASTDPAITGLTIDAQYTGDNLYETIESICTAFNIGFKVTLSESNQFIFSLYAGANRSYDQTLNPYVIFSPRFENMVNSNYLESKKTLKTVTLVAGEDQGLSRKTRIVGGGSDLARRELYTDARDISSSVEEEIKFVGNLNFSPVSLYGLTIANEGEGKAKVTGTPTRTNFTISATVATIPSIPKGKYKISGAPGFKDSPYFYKVTVAGVGTSINGEETEAVVSSARTNVAVTVSVQVPNGAALEEIYGSTFSPQLTLFAIHDDEYYVLLNMRGVEKLSENLYMRSFEGQVEAVRTFVYGKDFYKGDIVQIINEYGIEATVRVIEFVRCQDTTGYTTYPTFSVVE